MYSRVFSTHDAAQICKTHYTTVINWVESGKLEAYLTPGGHRRIAERDLLSFLDKYGMPVPPELKNPKKVILMVDDDKIALEEYREAFNDSEFDVIFATDGFEAGVFVYRKKPDLILLDFKMPGMNGFEVCEFLRGDKETAGIPIFAVTALTSKEDFQRIKECGVREYISKPVDIEKLLLLIRQTLGVKGKSGQQKGVLNGC